MLWLLTLLGFHNPLMLHEGKTGYFSRHLEKDEEFIVESKDPFLCVYFLKIKGVTMSLFVGDQLYQNITDSSSVTGIDFGDSFGRIIFRAIEQTKIVFSALVFPRFCSRHRYISSLPNLNLTFTDDNEMEDFRITLNQHFCFWPAAPTYHTIQIVTDTEPQFDNIKLHSIEGVFRMVSGRDMTEIISRKGQEYITWETDSTKLSKMFSIIIRTDKRVEYPFINQMLKGYQASDVSLFFVQEDKDKFGSSKKDSNDSKMEIILVLLSTITFVLIITSVVFVIWAVKIHNSYQDDNFDYMTGLNPEFKSKNDYKYASSDKMPQPYIIEPNP